MDTPQEVLVWYVLPAIRREFAISLKNEGLNQKEIAGSLDLTESAISQYIKKKRGEEVLFPKELREEIKNSAMRVAKKNGNMKSEIQKIIAKIHASRFICTPCHDYLKTENCCKICYHD